MEISKEPLAITKPRYRWLKRLCCVLLLSVILAGTAWAWRHHSARQHLNEVLAELDRTDPGWRLEDIEAAREQIADEDNSAGVINAVVQNLPLAWPPDELSLGHFQSQPPNEMLSVEDSVHLSVELARVRSALEIADKLADMPRGRHRLRNSRSTVFQAFPADQLRSQRVLTPLLLQSLWCSQSGEGKRALLACRAALNAARSQGDEPSQLSQFIRGDGVEYACRAIERTLGQGEAPPEDMADLQKLIEEEDTFPSLLIATRAERASGHRIFEGVEDGELPPDVMITRQTGRLERTLSPLWTPNVWEDHALFLSLMTRRIQEAQRPMHEQVEFDKAFVQVVGALPKKAIITRSLLPAFSSLGETFRTKRAYLRSTIVALAIERFRRDKQEWPNHVDQLCPQYLAFLPLDPFDGKPLRYRRVEEGVVVYSIGPDGLDNGGNLVRESRSEADADIGVRLWDVTRRRQPPRSKQLDEEKPR